MQVYTPPTDEYRFLFRTFGYDRVHKLPGYGDYDAESVVALLEQAGKFCKERMLPLNPIGDREGLKFDGKTGAVELPEGFSSLYRDFCEGGYGALCQDVEYGGGGAPKMIAVPLNEMFCATNKSFSMCMGLTNGLVEALEAHGSDEQKSEYLEKLISGEWTGTMCLTEPQAGTDLGLVRTTAVPEGDHYKLNGTKIWITFGEHNLADNIVHLVLARLPDAPEGIKGISVFIVPKKKADGSSNGVICAGLEHKMGIHASPTCVISFEDAEGYLVGQPHKGMRAMFTMMNAARLFVGLEGVALSEISYQTALEFAKDRRQSRSLIADKQDASAEADNILVHPDVRRMLLNVKASTQGMRALTVWIAALLDIEHKSEDEEERQAAQDLVALMTPIIKSFCTERGFANTSEAMQVLGGAGYTQDWSIEQYLRDMRIAMIYEGTNGIQALDLVGRKLPMDGGRLYRAWATHLGTFMAKNAENPVVADLLPILKEQSELLDGMTMGLAAKGFQDPEEAAAVASDYLRMFGHVAMAYVWAEVVVAAEAEGEAFLASKQHLARYYYHRILPEAASLAKIIESGKEHVMAVSDDEL